MISSSRKSSARDALREALVALSIDAAVEARGSIALLTVRDPAMLERLANADTRAQVIAAAKDAGYTTVAVELSA